MKFRKKDPEKEIEENMKRIDKERKRAKNDETKWVILKCPLLSGLGGDWASVNVANFEDINNSDYECKYPYCAFGEFNETGDVICKISGLRTMITRKEFKERLDNVSLELSKEEQKALNKEDEEDDE